MPTDLDRLLERAKIARERLDTATDQLNDELELVGDALKDLRLGVEGWVNLWSRPDGKYAELGWAKHAGHWVLVVGYGHAANEFGEMDETKPLSSATRADRLLAAEQLPTLLAKLVERVESEADKVSRAVDAVSALREGSD